MKRVFDKMRLRKKIIIKAPITKRLIMMGCDECGRHFYIEEEDIESVKKCCLCKSDVVPYPTYSFIAIPTMEEAPEKGYVLKVKSIK